MIARKINPSGLRPQGLRPTLPRELYLEVSSRCNSLCVTCPLTFGGREPARDLSLDEVRRLLEQFPALDRVVLHGIGEPLLNRDLPEMIRAGKARGAHVLFNSNIIGLTPRRAEALIRSGLDELRVSFDAARRETYARVRGVDALPKVVANLRAFVRLQRRLGSPTPRVALWFTALRDNLAELPDLIQLAADVGVTAVHLQRLCYFGEGLAVAEQSLHGRLGPVERALLAKCDALARSLGITFDGAGQMDAPHSLDGRPADPAPWQGCGRPWRLTYITARGNVLPCCFIPFAAQDYGSTIMGNVFETPIAAIWQGDKLAQFRERLRSDQPADPCQNCGVRWSL